VEDGFLIQGSRKTAFSGIFSGINHVGRRHLYVNSNDVNSRGLDWPELLGRLFDRHSAALELYARQFCDCPEDVVQEAFIELSRLGEVPNDSAAWLFIVVRNKAFSALRNAKRRKGHEKASAANRHSWFKPSHGDRIDAETAKTILEKLPREERETVIARLWGGLTFQQIAQLTGVTDSTAFRRYESALNALREKMRIPSK
jgi:RNA polymerase sigma-70 factor (ECF subfamily)